MTTDHPKPPTACVGCGGPPVERYCPHCGQDARRARLTWRGLVDDVWRHATLEGPLLRTLGGLATRPGAMVREYLDSRRRRYVHPVTLALVAGAFAVAVELQFMPAPSLPADAPLRLRRALEVQLFIGRFAHLITLVCLPVFVLVLRALLRRVPRTGAEHMVFAIFVFAGAFLLQAILSPLWVVAPPVVAAYVTQLAPVVYLLWAAAGYVPERPVVAIGAAFLADVVLYSLAFALSVGAAAVYMRG